MKKNIEPLDNYENQINDDSDILIEGDSNNVTINKHHKLSKTKILLSVGGITLGGLASGGLGYGIEHIQSIKKEGIMEQQIIELNKTNTPLGYLNKLLDKYKPNDEIRKDLINILRKILTTPTISYELSEKEEIFLKQLRRTAEILDPKIEEKIRDKVLKLIDKLEKKKAGIK